MSNDLLIARNISIYKGDNSENTSAIIIETKKKHKTKINNQTIQKKNKVMIII